MKRKVWGLLAILALSFGCSMAIVPEEVWAGYDECISGSKGHGGIDSVQWACSQGSGFMPGDGNSACSLWLGPYDSSTTQSIAATVTSTDASITIAYWGMCTNGAIDAVDVDVSGDNDSIDGQDTVGRGTWGSPERTSTSLNVGDFIEGITPTTSGGISSYTRTISIYRCNKNNRSNCSSQSVSITINVELQYTLSATAVDTNGNAIGNDPGSMTVKKDETATITANQINNYTFKCWSSGNNTSCDLGAEMSYSKTMTADTHVYAVYDKNEFEGRARLDRGDAVQEDTKYNTGWVQTDTTTTRFIDCTTSGCRASFDLALRTKSGAGSTLYSTWRASKANLNASQATEMIDSDVVFDKSAETIVLQRTGNSAENLRPGQEVCYFVAFNAVPADEQDAEVGACAKVPYNFVNSTKVESDSTTNVIYAGEETTIDASVTIAPKTNSVAENGNVAYATRVDDARWKLIVYQGEEKMGSEWGGDLCAYYSLSEGNKCGYSNEGTGDLNTNLAQVYEGATELKQGLKFYAPDLAAGSKVCVAAAVYPANSGADDNLDKNGNQKWAISGSKCFKVAKRPSFQVWGGNVITRGGIDTAVVRKSNLSGFFEENYEVENEYRMFGSWGELGVMAGGDASQFGSGVGLDSNESDKVCSWSKMTFANAACSTEKAGYFGGMESRIKNDFSKIKAQFNNIETTTEITVMEGVEKGVRRFIGSEEDLLITGNIKYAEENYVAVTEIPKIIIYAKGDIKISCEVEQIDAILMAEGTINTCVDRNSGETPEVNSAMRSRQLVINGIVMAKKIELNRTYGAATGSNSGVPAEIINYDPTMYFWGEYDLGTIKTGDLITTYLRETAPRY